MQQSKAWAQEIKAWAQQNKALVQQSKACAQQSKTLKQFCLKRLKDETGESVFGPHRCERIAFRSFAAPWCSKAWPRRSKAGHGRHFARQIYYSCKNTLKTRRAKVCLLRTGASGSPFCRLLCLGAPKQGPGTAVQGPVILSKNDQKRDGQKCVWTAQVRADCFSGGLMEPAANQPEITSDRRSKSI